MQAVNSSSEAVQPFAERKAASVPLSVASSRACWRDVSAIIFL